MSRRRAAVKREIQPDPKFGDVVVSKFMNSLMIDGRKSVAENILYGAFELIENRSGGDPLKVFHEAIDNVKPMTEVRSRRVGGATYQIPIEVRVGRRQALAIRWIIGVCRKRGENTMIERFAGELPSRSVKTPIVWPKPTRRSRTTVGRAPRFAQGI